MKMKEYFDVLGIDENSTKEEIRAAFLDKKSELQRQLLTKDPLERKTALVRLQELTKAYKEINSRTKNIQVSADVTKNNELHDDSNNEYIDSSKNLKAMDEEITTDSDKSFAKEIIEDKVEDASFNTCRVCGYKNNIDLYFCGKCGANLHEDLEKNTTHKENSILNIIDKYKKHIFAILAILTILVVAFGCLKNFVYSPEKLVVNYLTAISTKDYNKAYDYIFWQEDDFINKNNYIKSAEFLSKNKNACEKNLVHQLAIGVENIDIIKNNGESTIGGLHQYHYICKLKDGSNVEGNIDVVEIIGFWNKLLHPYKILDSQFTRPLDVEVETNAKLYVDGILMQNPTQTKRGTHNYNIPFLFYGNHVIKTEVPLCDPYELRFTLAKDTKLPLLCYWKSHLKKDVVKDMDKKAEEIQKKIIEASIKNLRFDELGLEFSDSRLENMYNQYQRFFNRPDGSGIYSMEIIEVEGDEKYNNRLYNPFKNRVHKINFKFTYTRKDRNGIQESRVGNGEGNLSVVYTIKDNKFVPDSIDTFRLRTH